MVTVCVQGELRATQARLASSEALAASLQHEVAALQQQTAAAAAAARQHDAATADARVRLATLEQQVGCTYRGADVGIVAHA